MTIQPGEFWVADIPFSSGAASKKRPVLVLWLDGMDIIGAAVTTAAARSEYDVPLTDWSQSGLKKPSTVRLARLDCLERSLLIARIGILSKPDAERLKQVWSANVKPAF